MLRDMGVMVESGIPIAESVRCIAEDGGSVKITRVCNQLLEDINGGCAVSVAFERQSDVFPDTVRGLAAIGDETGSLGRMLMEAAAHLERLLALKADSKQALIYPMFSFAAIFGAAAFWIVYVMPNLVSLFKQLNAKLPPITIAVLAAADWLSRHYGKIAVFLLSVVVGFVLLWRRSLGFRRRINAGLHRTPVIRVILGSAGLAFYAEYLGILVRAGLDAMNSLRIMENSIVDLYYKERVGQVRQIVSRGEHISAAMRMVGGFPAMMVKMIAVGEQSGTLDKQLEYLAHEYSMRLKRVVNTLAEVIKPLVVVIAGGVFLVLIIALLLPVYDLVRQAMARPH